MPAYVYHILHLLGILMIFTGYGALLARSFSGSTDVKLRKLGSITSGIGLLLVFVAGFALITKMGYGFTQGWILVKILVWAALGALIAIINRKPQLAGTLWWLLIGLGLVATVTVYAFRSLPAGG